MFQKLIFDSNESKTFNYMSASCELSKIHNPMLPVEK